jgi:hypothetical protein
MIKGIHLLLLASIVSLPSFALTPESLMRKCRAEPGAKVVINKTKGEYLSADGTQKCVQMRCAGSTSNSTNLTPSYVEGSDDISGKGGGIFAFDEFCKNKTDWVAEYEIEINTNNNNNNSNNNNNNNNNNSNININNDGGGFYVDGVLVSEADWRSACLVYYTRASKRGQVKRIRKKCRRGGGGGSVTIRGGGGVNGPGGYVVMQRSDGSQFNCTYTSSWKECQGKDGADIVRTVSYDECVNCGGRGGSNTADILGAILPPLAQFGSNLLWSGAYRASNRAWAGAAATGFEQCQISQTNHMHTLYGDPSREVTRDASGRLTSSGGYFADNELPYKNIAAPSCNGYQLGAFAGGAGFQGNGFGGFGNPYGAAGFSTGFQNGVSGPWGQFNPYGQVNGMGGFPGNGGFGLNLGIGMNGLNGFNGGIGGFGTPGFNGGIGVNGGIGGFGTPGFNGGIGGFNGGIGGFNGGIGGFNGGIGGFGTPGFNGGIGGFNGGIGGFNGGIGGFNGGIGGFNGGIGVNGGIGGFNSGIGGSFGNGTVPWGNGNGSYFNGTGGFNGGGFNGGGNSNFGNIQQSYALNQQALGQDAYYQQAALRNSFNQAGQNLYNQGGIGSAYGQFGGFGANGGYGYAPYSPGNMGIGMNLGFNLGF